MTIGTCLDFVVGKFTNLNVTGFDPDDFDGPVSIDRESGADCVQFLVGNHDQAAW